MKLFGMSGSRLRREINAGFEALLDTLHNAVADGSVGLAR